MLKKLVS
jgi:hypothetical protein